MNTATNQPDRFDPHRWGLPPEATADLADRLRRTWARFRACFKTKTHDGSAYAWVYLQGLLLLTLKRNIVNIARRVLGLEDDGQDLQQFISDSPWSAQAVFDQIQQALQQRSELSGGMLTLDESGDACAGDQKAGATRQYLGREGKVELGQVGVALGYYQTGTWAMVDAELYLPEVWFDQAHARLRKRWYIPATRTFATKPALGLHLIRHAQQNGLPFTVIGCDSLYGRDGQFRADLAADNLVYLADIPVNTQVYLTQPVVGVPETPADKPGRPFTQARVLNAATAVEVRTRVGPTRVRPAPRGDSPDRTWPADLQLRRPPGVDPHPSPCGARRMAVPPPRDRRDLQFLVEQRPGQHAVGATGLVAVSTLLRRTHLPGRQIGGRLGGTGGPQISRLAPPHGVGCPGPVVYCRNQTGLGAGPPLRSGTAARPGSGSPARLVDGQST